MQVKFLQNLGSDDANFCKQKFGETIDHTECVADAVVELPPKSAVYLGEKYKALFEPVGSVKAIAKKPEITAPAK